MSISVSSISSLRQRTGVSISACKDALDEAGGDEERAIEILRKRGIAQAAKKAMRDQKEGSVFLACTNTKAALILLGCETDFVARDKGFLSLGNHLVNMLLTKGDTEASREANEKIPEEIQRLGENISMVESHVVEAPIVGTYVHSNGKIGVIIGLKDGTIPIARDVAMHAAAMNPQVVSPEEISSDVVNREKEIWKEQLAKEGKPLEIMEKIMIGKEKKFREENALIKQEFVKEPNKKIEEYLGNARVVRYIRVAVG